LARRLTTLLPAMTLAEAIETTRIHRVAGLTGDRTATVDLTGVESIRAAHGAEATQYRTLDRDR
jgi:predicted ATPase with chaperone activity